jgi:hypothetical protein
MAARFGCLLKREAAIKLVSKLRELRLRLTDWEARRS